MKISAPLVKALNKQIEMEANAANAYLSAASWCDITGYDGAANFSMLKHKKNINTCSNLLILLMVNV